MQLLQLGLSNRRVVGKAEMAAEYDRGMGNQELSALVAQELSFLLFDPGGQGGRCISELPPVPSRSCREGQTHSSQPLGSLIIQRIEEQGPRRSKGIVSP